MNSLKKALLLVMMLTLAVCVLASCGGNSDDNNKPDETEAPHVHVSGNEWQIDKDSHWKVCGDDGEVMEKAEHDLSSGRCAECGVEVVEVDGVTKVFFFDEKENWIRCINYTADGKTTEDTMEYVYDGDGNITSLKMNTAGKLSYEAEYLVDTDGYNYEAKSTEYKEDGSKYVCEYTNDGDMTKETMYKADGTVEYDYRIEHTYGDDGKKVSEKTYSGDKLVKEVNYIVLFADSWGGGSYKLEVINYKDDGTKTVEYFTENGEPYVE